MKSETFEVSAEVCADPVHEFYTNHPFPPPVEHLERDMWQNEDARRAEYHLLWPHKEYRADLEVLVAGCGTSEAAKFALNHPAANVVGIDVTAASIEHHDKLKQKYNLTNLKALQLPVENAGATVRRVHHQVHRAIRFQYRAERAQPGIGIDEMVQHAGANDEVEVLVQVAGILNR